MNYLSIENISISFGYKTLFEDISFGLDQGQKAALVGINGCGKSTLLKVAGGELLPDDGKVSVRKGIRIGFLSQDPKLDPDLTAQEILFASDSPALSAIRDYEMLITQAGAGEDKQAELQTTMDRIDALDAWDIEVKVSQILSKLEVNFLDRPVSQLSGGQKKRVALARVLIEEPELIILDEPTNHLDLESIEWLERFLSTSKQSLLMVTHDRYFLDNVTNEILELEGGNLYTYKGKYEYYLEKKAERELMQQRVSTRAKNLLRTELEWLRRSPKARTTKSKSRISGVDKLEKKSESYAVSPDLKLIMRPRRLGSKIIDFKNTSKAWGEQKILDKFSYTFKKNDRIGIAGKNGVGKTTFLNLMLGELAADSGSVKHGDTVVFGYYRQGGLSFKSGHRVIDTVREVAEAVDLGPGRDIPVETFLEFFMFPRSMQGNFVESLSGGEKRRLHLVKVLMQHPNFLILDEPTNDLDLVTLRKLEEFLLAFQGCLVIVSHDRFFMDRLVDHVFVMEGEGKIQDFPGSYSQYWKWKSAQKKSKPAPEKTESTKPKAPAKTRTREKRKLSYKEIRELEQLETRIEEIENEKAKLVEVLNSGTTDYDLLKKTSEQIATLDNELESASERWMQLEELAEQLLNKN